MLTERSALKQLHNDIEMPSCNESAEIISVNTQNILKQTFLETLLVPDYVWMSKLGHKRGISDDTHNTVWGQRSYHNTQEVALVRLPVLVQLSYLFFHDVDLVEQFADTSTSLCHRPTKSRMSGSNLSVCVCVYVHVCVYVCVCACVCVCMCVCVYA